MKRHHTTSSLLLLLIVVIEDSKASYNGLNDELRFLHREIGLLRSENQDQKKEIVFLKEAIGFQNNKTIPEQIVGLIKKELDNKKKKESLIPKSPDANQNISPGNKANSRNKRPYRLVPVNKDFNIDGNQKAFRKFYGPPTNCSDLSQLGYTLNGFYLVTTTEQSSSSLKNGSNRKVMQVKAISCMFKHPNGIYDANNLIENNAIVSLMNQMKSPHAVPTDGVHFRFRTSIHLEPSILNSLYSTIKFDKTILNVGGGQYDKSQGMFTIPKTGIYQVTFSGMISSNTASISNPTLIELRVNDGFTEYIRIVDNQLSNQVLLANINLRRGDNISVRINIDKEFTIRRKLFQLLSLATLSGSLLEETN